MQDEGIMVKDLESRWIANDRKGAWMKLKPDHAFVSEIDAVVIGGHFGTGRRRGEIAEYLLALAEKPGLGQAKPSTFISMCRSAHLFWAGSVRQRRMPRLLQQPDQDNVV